MGDTPQKAKGGRKNRKVGRGKLSCERYRRENRRERNKARRLVKHMEHQPNDMCGAAAYKRMIAIIGKNF